MTGLLAPRGFHSPTGLFTPERCQRQRDGHTERTLKLSVTEDSSHCCEELLVECNANGFGEGQGF